MADKFIIQKAIRQLVWCKVALIGPSGSGKTYSALKVARGMQTKLKELDQETGILMANNESTRGLYYANEFEYDIMDIAAPHNPEKYVELIQFAVDEDYKILIIDSTSHEWEGKGGCLDLHNQAGGTWAAWAKVTPRHNEFLYAIADSPIHIIATMRGKDQYEVEKTTGGKTSIRKVGIGPKQREGVEYEFTCSFLLDQSDNMALYQKDNTHIFEDLGNILFDDKHGVQIIEWANSGDAVYIPVVRDDPPTEKEMVKTLANEVIDRCKELGGSKNEAVVAVLDQKKKGYLRNPKNIKDLAVLKSLLGELKDVKPLKESK